LKLDRTGYDVPMDDDTEKSLEELLEPGSTLMVGTAVEPDTWDFRPLTVAHVRGPRVQIPLDTNEDWVRAFHGGDRVHVTMGDTRTNTWLSYRGTASITADDALIDQLWNPFAAAYFDEGRDSPGIAVMQIDASEGRYWSTTSGRVGALLSIIKAKLGRPEDAGQHGAIGFDRQ
jgi:general stress protein 26